MMRRLIETPGSRTTKLCLGIILLLALVLGMFSEYGRFMASLNYWIQVHIPAWMAVTDIIIVSLFPFIGSMLPLGSEAYYLTALFVLPFFVLLPASLKQKPGLGDMFLISVAYFFIRWSFFYNSLPRLKQPDEWKKLNELMIQNKESISEKKEIISRSNMNTLLAINFCFTVVIFSWCIFKHTFHLPIWLMIADFLVLSVDSIILISIRRKSRPLIFFLGILAGASVAFFPGSLSIHAQMVHMTTGGAFVLLLLLWIRKNM